MWPFRHTASERGMWRGWLHNGQSLELSLGRSTVGLRILIHSDDADQGDRMLNIALGFAQAFIPLGIVRLDYQVGDEPSWGFDLSREFGFNLNWGRRRKGWDMPLTPVTLRYEQQMPNGSWEPVIVRVFRRLPSESPATETHPYSYTLRNGEVQNRTATISKRRHIIGRVGLKWLGWPREIRESICVNFSDEVGEGSGSWKGGTVGCSYDLRPGETPLTALRRMEAERKFK